MSNVSLDVPTTAIDRKGSAALPLFPRETFIYRELIITIIIIIITLKNHARLAVSRKFHDATVPIVRIASECFPTFVTPFALHLFEYLEQLSAAHATRRIAARHGAIIRLYLQL